MTTAALGQSAIDLEKPADGDDIFWSVTTIIGIMDKPALLYWAAEQAADCALDEEPVWKAMLETRGRPDAIKYIRDAMNRRPKITLSAADLGTCAHRVFQEYALTGTYPTPEFITETIRGYAAATVDIPAETAVIIAMLAQFDRWLQQFTPTYQATEIAVYSDSYGYAGSLDAILAIDGVTFLADYKTSRDSYDRKGEPRGPYPDQVGLQLAAYRYAELAAPWRRPAAWLPRRFEKQFRRYYLLNDAERAQAVPIPAVDSGLCIFVTPEHCNAYCLDANQEAHRAFGNAQELFRWRQETARQQFHPTPLHR